MKMTLHMGIPTRGNLLVFSVGFCENSHKNPEGMGWKWVLKFHSHGNPALAPQTIPDGISVG